MGTGILLVIMAILFVLAVLWPASIEASESLSAKSQRPNERFNVRAKGFNARLKELNNYLWVFGATTIIIGIATTVDAYFFFQEASKEYFSAGQGKQDALFISGVGGLLIFAGLVYVLAVLSTKKEALQNLERDDDSGP